MKGGFVRPPPPPLTQSSSSSSFSRQNGARLLPLLFCLSFLPPPHLFCPLSSYGQAIMCCFGFLAEGGRVDGRREEWSFCCCSSLLSPIGRGERKRLSTHLHSCIISSSVFPNPLFLSGQVSFFHLPYLAPPSLSASSRPPLCVSISLIPVSDARISPSPSRTCRHLGRGKGRKLKNTQPSSPYKSAIQ